MAIQRRESRLLGLIILTDGIQDDNDRNSSDQIHQAGKLNDHLPRKFDNHKTNLKPL